VMLPLMGSLLPIFPTPLAPARLHLQRHDSREQNGRIKLADQGFHHHQGARNGMNGGNITEPDRRESHNAEIKERCGSGLYSLGSPKRQCKRAGMHVLGKVVGKRKTEGEQKVCRDRAAYPVTRD
jgi:hypothetical protein